jgi:dynein light intermediate chain, axonemal
MSGMGFQSPRNSNEVSVTPPETLVKFEAPLFAGIEPGSGRYPKASPNQEGGGGVINPKLDDMINAMLPPREWVEDSGTWVQYVSKEPASRLDVIALQEQLDKKLNERKARETGICPVREELYGQCMEELIRQITLDGPERGLLMMRVRDEIRMSIDAYKTLFTNSVNFGIKKQIRAEQGIPELETQATDLEKDKSELELEVYELKSKLDIMEKRETERRHADEKRRKEEIDFLKTLGSQLDSFLKAMNSSK